MLSIDFSVYFTAPAGLELQYIAVGSVPNELILDRTTGILSGIPTQFGTFNLAIQVKDQYDRTVTSNVFQLQIYSETVYIVTITADNGVYEVEQDFELIVKNYE